MSVHFWCPHLATSTWALFTQCVSFLHKTTATFNTFISTIKYSDPFFRAGCDLWVILWDQQSHRPAIICHLHLCLSVSVSWWHYITYSFVNSSAVLMGGGIRPAAVTLRSLVRKLKVAHAFGCNTTSIKPHPRKKKNRKRKLVQLS